MGFFSNISKTIKQSTKVTIPKITATTKAVSGTVAGGVKGVAAITAAAAEKKKKDQISKSSKKAGGGTTKTTKSSGTATTPQTEAVSASNLIQWGSVKFFVNPMNVRSFKGLSIKSSTTTETEEKDEDAYVIKKKNGAYEISMTAIIDKRLGESNVMSVAVDLAEKCRTGYSDYMYTIGKKLVTPKVMGTGATIQNIVMSPGGTWISCEVSITAKQCSKGGGGTESTPTTPSSGNKGPWTATVYYSGSSGAVSSVKATSNVSYADAQKKAYAKVPKNALWASTKKDQASNQSNAAKVVARSTVNNAKKQSQSSGSTSTKNSAITYVESKTKSIQK